MFVNLICVFMLKRELDKFYKKLHSIQKSGATRNESVISDAFKSLLEAYCDTKDLIILREQPYKNTKIRPDGTVRGALPNIDYGYWESKDIFDDIDKEIDKKIETGYPTENIIFENSKTIVLIQKREPNKPGEEVLRCQMSQPKDLDRLLRTFIDFQPKVITDFYTAIEQFKNDVPYVVDELRLMINEQSKKNDNFKNARSGFWELCRQSIDKTISADDIREMLIQHILTDEIFSTVYNENRFHRENNIAIELQKVTDTFFTKEIRYNTLAKIDRYYETIKTYAAQIGDYHQKQDFLKIVYENFYKAYNPKGADKLGIVFTPNEIVKFMIESTDYLVENHFGKTLSDKNVHILDPATGTGTFITDLIRHINPQNLEYKYRNEIHANEVSILPYYIANLNIEYTLKQKLGNYIPFNNIVFVDTLENFHALNWERKGKDQGFMQDMYALSKENLERIKSQNTKKISVIIGNPPYNAHQQNWNDFNKNKDYPQIDERIKNTYVKLSKAQKTSLYDMFSRFFRWASDRLNEDGVIAFITNNALINKKTYDGFRASILKEFQYAYIIDLGGDLRDTSEKDENFKYSNVFPIKVGVAITFLIKDVSKKDKKCLIRYVKVNENSKQDKLHFLADNKFHLINFKSLIPDKDNNWLFTEKNGFENLIPLYEKNGNGIFANVFNGVNTSRDEWVTDFNSENLAAKIKYFISVYNENIKKHSKINNIKELENFLDITIKWSRDLLNKFKRKRTIKFKRSEIILFSYRPFIKKLFYSNLILNDVLTANHFKFYGNNLNLKNSTILFSVSNRQEFSVSSTNCFSAYQYFMDPAKCASLYYFNEKNDPIINITDWGLKQFSEHYKDDTISKEEIFHYTYAVIHNPIYREKYKQNLKREFPGLPFYDNFRKWSAWGKELMDLHINYETVEAYNLNVETEELRENPKPKLKAIKDKGTIILDENTTISGLPNEVWDYKLGNRSAIEWILNQYQETTYNKKTIETYPDKKTLHDNFNTYKFADYKDQVLDLIKRLTTVSVKTVQITNAMKTQRTISN